MYFKKKFAQIHIRNHVGVIIYKNMHIYDNNIARTRDLLAGNENIKFDLNV